MKLLAGLIGVSIAVAVVAGCGDARIPSTSTPAPPTVTPALSGTFIGNWELNRNSENIPSVAMVTWSNEGDDAFLTVICYPGIGLAVSIVFIQQFNTQAGLQEIKVSTIEDSKVHSWELDEEWPAFEPMNQEQVTSFLLDIENSDKLEFAPELELDPLRWAGFNLTGSREALRQVRPCNEDRGAMPLTPTPTATPAPDGEKIGNWELERESEDEGTVLISTNSIDSPGATLAIGCILEIGSNMFVVFDEPFSTPSGYHRIRIATSEGTESLSWSLDGSHRLLLPLNMERVMRLLSYSADSAVLEFVPDPAFDPPATARFNLTGKEEAFRQIFPCDGDRVNLWEP